MKESRPIASSVARAAISRLVDQMHGAVWAETYCPTGRAELPALLARAVCIFSKSRELTVLREERRSCNQSVHEISA